MFLFFGMRVSVPGQWKRVAVSRLGKCIGASAHYPKLSLSPNNVEEWGRQSSPSTVGLRVALPRSVAEVEENLEEVFHETIKHVCYCADDIRTNLELFNRFYYSKTFPSQVRMDFLSGTTRTCVEQFTSANIFSRCKSKQLVAAELVLRRKRPLEIHEAFGSYAIDAAIKLGRTKTVTVHSSHQV